MGTAVAYLWNLSINGWANSFLFGGDSGRFAVVEGVVLRLLGHGQFDHRGQTTCIAVDSVVVGAGIRIEFWSILVPEALMGVASVALVYVITRRYFGHWAGILAGLVLAVTPVAAMMFRFNNPEALLILLMVASVWALLRGVEDGRWRWLILTGALVGFGFPQSNCR